MRKNFRRRLEVPLYNSTLVLSVSHDILAARRRENALLGEQPNLDDYEGCGGLTCYSGQRCGIFLDYDWLKPEPIAHELMHATMRILDAAGVYYAPCNPEPFTYLNGYLHKWTYYQLHKAKIKVSH